ncbi:MAG: hypothetical protein HY724_03295 [Candidatus Rokubacteria bacterium]|nr:hypothetical protein [Candidatus Rokubacteria bacterium]
MDYRSFLGVSWRLKAALREPGCPVCRRGDESESNFFFWLLIEQYYVPGFMSRLMDSFGFCRAHSVVLGKLGSPYVTSVMYEYLTTDTRRRIERALAILGDENPEAAPARRKERRLRSCRSLLGRKESCPACEERGQTETEELRRLVEGCERFPQWRALVGASDGLCVGHFLQAKEFAPCEVLRDLADLQVRKLRLLEGQLREYLRKCDWTHRDEPRGEEQGAWRRAIEHYGGSAPDDVVSNVAEKFRGGRHDF